MVGGSRRAQNFVLELQQPEQAGLGLDPIAQVPRGGGGGAQGQRIAHVEGRVFCLRRRQGIPVGIDLRYSVLFSFFSLESFIPRDALV